VKNYWAKLNSNMAATYVVKVAQGKLNHRRVQVVSQFHTERAAHEFISSLEKIVHKYEEAERHFYTSSEAIYAYRHTFKKLAAIHPRSIIDECHMPSWKITRV